jgi:hypothetical protein
VYRLVRLLAAVAVVLPAVAGAARPRPISFKFPPFVVPARGEREVCTFLRIPQKKAFDVAGSRIVAVGGRGVTAHHVYVYAYLGAARDRFLKGEILDDKGCFRLGPDDRAHRVLVAASQTVRAFHEWPEGLAQRLEPVTEGGKKVLGFVVNTHWVNEDTRPRKVSARIKLVGAKRGSVKRLLQPIVDASAGAEIDVPPGASGSVVGEWAPGRDGAMSVALGGVPPPAGPVCVAGLAAVMHKRGARFRVDLVDDAAASTTPVYLSEVYSDPPYTIFDGRGANLSPLYLAPGSGRRLRYECVHVNGASYTNPDSGLATTTAVRRGCEETDLLPPGRTARATLADGKGLTGPAKLCTTDADCCGGAGPCAHPADATRQLTGRCVSANLVFGTDAEDDACQLPGVWYAGDPTAPPGSECALGRLPAL